MTTYMFIFISDRRVVVYMFITEFRLVYEILGVFLFNERQGSKERLGSGGEHPEESDQENVFLHTKA